MQSYVVKMPVELGGDPDYIEHAKQLARCEAFYKLAAEFIQPNCHYQITTHVQETTRTWVFAILARELSAVPV